ncbi:MAG: hypothetical protein K0R98_2042, partial [Rickettsiaceae bacterium]|nr:hypothetical protein [Rickettsiaceae bacterium]
MKTKEELENTYQDYKTGAIITGFIGGILMIGGSVGIALTIGDPGPLSGSSTVFILGAMSGCYTTWGTYRAVKYRQKLAAMDIERGNAPAIEMNRAPAVAAAQAPVISPDLLEAPVKSSPAPVIASNSVSSAQQRVYNVDAILK